MADSDPTNPELATEPLEQAIKTQTIETDYIAPVSVVRPIKEFHSDAASKGKATGGNWMTVSAQDKRFKDLIILGTHYSCALSGPQQTQSTSIPNQLSYGVRFLDLHVAYYENDIWLYHTIPTAKLGDILIEIGQFIKSSPQEKIIVNLIKAKDSPNEMNWSMLQQLLNLQFTLLLIPKSQSDFLLKDMKGSVALIAPPELILEKEKNWGPECLSAYLSPETSESPEAFHTWIEDICLDYLEKPDKKGALAWVECNFKNYKIKMAPRKVVEMREAQGPGFLNCPTRLNVNIVSLSYVDKRDFTLTYNYFSKHCKAK